MWIIKPLQLATLILTKVASIAKLGPSANPGEIIRVPSIAWLLTHEKTGQHILVDTGPSEDSERGERFHSPIERTDEQQLDYVLRKEGVEPESIETVILTHLHWDHGYGVFKLPNAKVYLQRDELQYAVAPFAVHIGGYELNDTSQTPFFLQYFHQLVVVDGDKTLCDGIKLIKLAGHSPGSQGVLVDGRRGQYLITGDVYFNDDNERENIPTGTFTNLFDYYASFDKVKELGEKVILLHGHDQKVFDILR